MPQLDILTYTTQVTWLIVLFFFSYYIIVVFVLKNIYIVFKSRKDIVLVNEFLLEKFNEEFVVVQNNLKIFVKNIDFLQGSLFFNLFKDLKFENLLFKDKFFINLKIRKEIRD